VAASMTANRLLFLGPSVNPFGVGTIVLFEPSRCSARVRYLGTPFAGPFVPTTQMSRAEITARPPCQQAWAGTAIWCRPSA